MSFTFSSRREVILVVSGCATFSDGLFDTIQRHASDLHAELAPHDEQRRLDQLDEELRLFASQMRAVRAESKIRYREERAATAARDRSGMPALPIRQYPRPLRKGRACGGGAGWRVRI